MKPRRRYIVVPAVGVILVTVMAAAVMMMVGTGRVPTVAAYRTSPLRRQRQPLPWGCHTTYVGTNVVSQSSPSPSWLWLSSTQVDASEATTTTFTTTPDGSRRRRRSSKPPQHPHRHHHHHHRHRRKPPLVDSDLLRFLNTTQTLWNTNDDNCNDMEQVFRTNRHEANATAASIVSSVDLETNNNNSNNNSNSNNIAAEIFNWTDRHPSDDAPLVHAWMAQYECTAIVARLMSLGATRDAAHAVGATVERRARSRAQVQRMRSYVKYRNHIWKQRAQREPGTATGTTTTNTSTTNPNHERTMAVDQVEEETCDLTPFRQDCSNHNNMVEIINVMMEYGLSAKDICEILIVSPSIAFMQPRKQSWIVSLPNNGNDNTNNNNNYTTTMPNHSNAGAQQSLEEILDRILVRLLMGSNPPYELNLRKYDARKVLRNTPGILTIRGSEAAYQIIRLLVNLGVSTNSLSRDKNNLPVLLSRQPNDVFRLVAFLSSDAVRMPVTKIGPLLRRTEGQDLCNAIAPSRAILMGSGRMGDSMKQQQQQRYAATQNLYTMYNGLLQGTNTKSTSPSHVATQIQKVVVNDIYRRMSETAWTLRNEIGTSDLGLVIAAYPSVLLLDASRQILPTAQYLMEELDILSNDLPSILQLYPALLRTDVEQMRNVVSYLTSLAVAEDNLGSIFRSFPVLLTLDIEHDMEPVVKFLQSIGVSNVGRFISRLPPILGYSVETELRPKFDYLHSISSDARFKITKFPAYFSYPLERVIKSRFEYLRNVKGIPTPLLSLDHVLCSGDKDFATKVCQDANVTQYAKFMQDRQDAIRTQSNALRRASNEEGTESTLTPGMSSSSPLPRTTTDPVNVDPRNATFASLVNNNDESRANEPPSFPSGTAAITS